MHRVHIKKSLDYLTLANLTKPNLRSRAPNPAGASTHPIFAPFGMRGEGMTKIAKKSR